ncbi:MAG TPA: DUF5666 domain-containing protein [Thermoleophilaceae bacterium]|nr:DUF5666 domain-containing protein [Thermoleophilaceae bacterium]
MKRLLPSCVAAIALLAIPAAASAQTGAVLRVNRAHHKLEIVDATHVVRSYGVRAGRAARKLRAGAKVSFKSSAGRITALRVEGRARKIAFLGKVVSSGGKGVVLRLGDGQQLKLAKRQFGTHRKRAHRSSVQINLQGLTPGQVVLITETSDAAGNVAITIKVMQGGATQNGDDQDVTGTISALGAGSLTIQADDGSTMSFQADDVLLEDFEVGDQVDVTYYADADGSLVADDVEPVDDGSDGGDDVDAIGTVTALDPNGGSITVQVDGAGTMTFQADADLLDGVVVGDHVDVTYFQDTDGYLVADDVEPADDGSDNSGE